jgi:predicted outer membrane protein
MQFSTRRILAAACAALVSAGATACAAGMGAGGSVDVGAEAHASMSAVHTAEIQEGQMGARQATNAQVRAFAQQLVADHRPFLQQEQQLASQMGLTAQAGASVQVPGLSADLGVNANTQALMMSIPTSRMLVEQHARAMADLGDEAGAEFDREFMDRQIAAHRQALALATRFEGAVQNTQQRILIAQERAAVQAHLQAATQIRASLQ